MSAIWNFQSTPRCLALHGLVPCSRFSPRRLKLPKSASFKALPCRRAQFIFDYVQPTSVFWGLTEFQPPQIGSRLLREKGFVERAFGMRIKIITDQDHFLSLGVTRLQEARDFAAPVDLGALLADAYLTPSREWFAERESARCTGPFVFVVHAYSFGKAQVLKSKISQEF